MSASKRIYKKKMFQTKQYGKETRNRKPEIYCCCCILRAWPSSASHFSIFFFSLFLLWPVQDAQQLWFVVFPSFLKNQIERKKTSTFLPALQHEREREKGNLSCIIYPGRWSRRERKKKLSSSSSSSCTTKLHTLWMTATHTRHLAAVVVVAAAASPAVQTGPASSRSSAGFQPAKRLC